MQEDYSRVSGDDGQLEQLFQAYRAALPDPEPSVNFMPEMWAKIEERRMSADWLSSSWFARLAKGLVTAAVAAYLIVAMMTTSAGNSASYFNGTFVEALVADHVSSLEPLHLDRIAAQAELDLE